MIMKQLSRGHFNSFCITIVRRYGNFDHLHFFQPITGQQTNWNTNACDVIGWKKCRWSKFRRTLVHRCYGLNLGGLVFIQSGYRGVQTQITEQLALLNLLLSDKGQDRSNAVLLWLASQSCMHSNAREPHTTLVLSLIQGATDYGRQERK